MAMETESAPTPSNDLSSFFLPTVNLFSFLSYHFLHIVPCSSLSLVSNYFFLLPEGLLAQLVVD